MTTVAKLGTIRVVSAAEYGREAGYAVEQLRYDQYGNLDWCVPGWIEDRWGESGFFASEAEADGFLERVRG